MDTITVPHKIRIEVATYQGEWTAEQIAAGEAGTPTITITETWYEPGPAGSKEIVDPLRIDALEATTSKE
jgi:hypothetical protein